MITKRISLTAIAAVLVTALGATAAIADGDGDPYQFGGPLWRSNASAVQQAAANGQGMMGSNGMMGPMDQAQKSRMIAMCDHMMNQVPTSSPGTHT